MKILIKAFVASLFLICMLAGVSAHTRESASDSEAITTLMKGLWETPDIPLAVEPIVLSGDYGLAGWTQSARGGRALLHKEDGHWAIVVCGGDNLKDSEVLMTTGMDHHTAHSLADGMKQAEASLPEAKLKLFSSFEGLLKMASEHAQNEHASHENSH